MQQLLRFLLLVSLLSLTSLARADGSGLWLGMGSMNQPRQEVGAARIGDAVFVVGGLLPGLPFTATNTVERLDLSSGVWSFVAPVPVALDHMCLAAHGGRLFVIGGFSGDFQPRAEVWIYDPAGDSWSAGTPLPSPRGAAWAVTHLDRIYLFGGTGPGGVSTTTWIYDPLANSWTTGAPMPTPREHLTAVGLGDLCHVLGGRVGSSTAAHEAYRPSTDTWVTLAPMPTARSAMGVAAFGGRIYVMGGETPVLFAVNESYDPSTDSWATGPPMPLPRHGLAAVTLEDRILFPGGGAVQGLQPVSTVDAFLPVLCPGTIVFCACDAGAPCGNLDAQAGCANSTGAGARMQASGSVSLALDDLVLTADQVPPNQFGMFFMGPATARVPLSDGLRCVASGTSSLFRYSVGSSGAGGQFVLGTGLGALSQMRFPPAGWVTPGNTWNFQCWYRDPGGPCATGANLSPAIGVTFGS